MLYIILNEYNEIFGIYDDPKEARKEIQTNCECSYDEGSILYCEVYSKESGKMRKVMEVGCRSNATWDRLVADHV